MALKNIVDGFVSVARGMNENVHPMLLNNNEVARAVNVDLSDGLLRTRAGFSELPLWTRANSWLNNEGDTVEPIDYFRNGKFQGATRYRYHGQDYLIAVLGQLLWRVNLATHEVELYGWAERIKDIPKVNMTTWRCWFCQVESYMLVQDGINPPWIINGRHIRRSIGANVKGKVGTDAQLLKNVGGVVDAGAVTAENATYKNESNRVKVLMEEMVTDLTINDKCTVRFRNGESVTGVITGMKDDGEDKYYLIKFEVNRDWTVYGMKRYDNLSGTTINHGMLTVGRQEVPEVPAGTAMAYGHGRLFVVRNDRYIVASDIFLSWRPDSVLKYNEILDLSMGGALGIPAEMGNIVNMTFVQNAMSGTGLGSLMVFCENGIGSYAVQTPRAQWLDTDISTVLFTSSGGVGQYCSHPVNNDIMYLSWDGLRSLRFTAASAVSQGIIFDNKTLSENIQQVWRESAEWAWKYASLAFVNNRVYFTSKASRGIKLEDVPNKINTHGEEEIREPIEEVRFKSIVSMYPASYNNESIMIYNGIWTGYDFLQIFGSNLQGQHKLLAFARDADEQLQLLSLTNTIGNDSNKRATVSRVYTGGYDFFPGVEYHSDSTFGQTLRAKAILKRAEYVDIWLSNIYEKTTVRLYGRPIGYSGWRFCGEFTVEAGASQNIRSNAWSQFRRKQRITIPRINCDSVSGQDLMTASDFQFCIEWEGGLQIDRATFYATMLPEEINLACTQPQGRQLEATGFNDYDYVVKEI